MRANEFMLNAGHSKILGFRSLAAGNWLGKIRRLDVKSHDKPGIRDSYEETATKRQLRRDSYEVTIYKLTSHYVVTT